MSLYLVRHAHAVDAAEDPARPLSHRGRKQIRKLAAFLKDAEEIEVGEIWHSPLARSRETATLLRTRLDLGARLVEQEGLEPEDDPAPIALRLQRRTAPLAIVGHEPHLSALASLLIVGNAAPPRFVFKKASVLALERRDEVWTVRWLLGPDLL